MPKLISELAQGNAFSRSSDGGQLADTATRVFKIILNTPNEAVDIMSAVNVQIGDPYSATNQIPCVSVEGRADGESRLVRIVTCQYRTSGMVDGEGGTGLPDPMLVMPDLRPANFSTSTSLYEMPAVEGSVFDNDRANLMLANLFSPLTNPAGDMYDGVTKLAPITVIRVTQFNAFPGTIYAEHCGKINQETMNLGSYLTCNPHTVMFRGVEAQPHVETFGITTYRGFMNSYEFMYRPNVCKNNFFQREEYGWDLNLIVSGFNCKIFDPASPRANNSPDGGQDPFGVPLQREGDYGPIIEPFKLQKKAADKDGKVRAMVRVAGSGDEIHQAPSAQPIALNEDGTPRSSDSSPPVLTERYQVQEEIDLTQTLQLRLN
jgi:hypothetical protein